MEKINLREQLEQILTDNLQTIKDDLQQLEPKDRIKVLMEITRFVLPTLKSVENKDSLQIEQPFFNINFKD